MSFVQIIDCRTRHPDELNQLMDRWLERSRGRRTATHAMVGQDRSDPEHVIEIVEFPSYADAVRNAELPETDDVFREMVALCVEMPTFLDIELIRNERHETRTNKETARRFFEEVLNGGNLDAMDELFTEDCRDHDPMNATQVEGVPKVRQELGAYLDAFDLQFTVLDQVAEGERVTTRWSAEGWQRGTFRGLRPGGRPVTMTGHTTHRLRDGRITETWWNRDDLGLTG